MRSSRVDIVCRQPYLANMLGKVDVTGDKVKMADNVDKFNEVDKIDELTRLTRDSMSTWLTSGQISRRGRLRGLLFNLRLHGCQDRRDRQLLTRLTTMRSSPWCLLRFVPQSAHGMPLQGTPTEARKPGQSEGSTL